MLCKFLDYSERQFENQKDNVVRYSFGVLHDLAMEELRDAQTATARKGIFIHDVWGSEQAYKIYDEILTRIKGEQILFEMAEKNKSDTTALIKCRINKNFTKMIFESLVQFTHSGKRKKEWPTFSRKNAEELYKDISFMMAQDVNKNDESRMLMYYFINYTLSNRFGLKEELNIPIYE